MHYVKLRDLCLQLEVDDDLVRTLCDEGVVRVKHTLDEEPVISSEDAERLRISVLLLRELDVNLPGVEVILHMREDLLAMQRQFDDILSALVEELRKRLTP